MRRQIPRIALDELAERLVVKLQGVRSMFYEYCAQATFDSPQEATQVQVALIVRQLQSDCEEMTRSGQLVRLARSLDTQGYFPADQASTFSESLLKQMLGGKPSKKYLKRYLDAIAGSQQWVLLFCEDIARTIVQPEDEVEEALFAAQAFSGLALAVGVLGLYSDLALAETVGDEETASQIAKESADGYRQYRHYVG